MFRHTPSGPTFTHTPPGEPEDELDAGLGAAGEGATAGAVAPPAGVLAAGVGASVGFAPPLRVVPPLPPVPPLPAPAPPPAPVRPGEVPGADPPPGTGWV